MEKVTSPDGTQIAFEKTGRGEPLVLVHGGGGSDHKRWEIAGFRKLLADHFKVYAVDRRGRGESGDSPEYSLEKEFEDIAAVIDFIDEPVVLFGHSYGAQIGLETALLTDNIRKLILYEPVFKIEGVKYDIFSEEFFNRMQKMIDEGNSEGALVIFMKEIVNLTEEELETYKSSPNWKERVDATHTITREEIATKNYQFDLSRFKELRTPTLLFSGTESPTLFKEVTKVINEVLPNSKIVNLEGQGHVAMNLVPEILLQEILSFSKG